jgi:tRNA(Ile)-lysidine synthase
LRPAAGESVEALARDQRYAALGRMARAAGATLVLLAHHRRDQAETLLLQALRGGGVAGLAGMPARVERDGLTWARPWLALPRGAIEAYVRRYRLTFVEDDSNADPRFARNRLRHEVWPALAVAFPQAEARLADAALGRPGERRPRRAAALDLARCADARGLDLAAWRRSDRRAAARHCGPGCGRGRGGRRAPR